MKGPINEYLRSCAVSLLVVVLIGLIASIQGWSAVGTLLLPGYVLAGVIFPEGAHSTHGLMWFVLAVVMNVLLFAWPVLWVSRLVKQSRKGF